MHIYMRLNAVDVRLKRTRADEKKYIVNRRTDEKNEKGEMNEVKK